MGTPSTTLATLRPELAATLQEFDLAMDHKGFIAHRVLPVFEANEVSGKFGRIPIDQLLQARDTLRAPGSGYSRGQFTFVQDSYACEEHGAEEPVDDREAKIYRHYFDAEVISASRAYDAVLRNAERRAAAAIFNTSTWTPTSVTNEWDDAANATPGKDVETAVQSVWDACGIWPNALIINRKVFRNLRNVDDIIDRMKYQGFHDVVTENITASILAQVFDLEHVIVAGSAKNTADEGQDVSIAPIWSSEYAMICRISSSPDIREPCLGRTFHWGEDGSDAGGTFETYRDEVVRADIVRCRHDVDEKLFYAAGAELLDNISS